MRRTKVIEVDSTVKVNNKTRSTKYSCLAFKPRRKGRVIAIDTETSIATVRFPKGKREAGYYFHDHQFHLKDLIELNTRKPLAV